MVFRNLRQVFTTDAKDLQEQEFDNFANSILPKECREFKLEQWCAKFRIMIIITVIYV